ncbi:MAG: hypothetical protein PHD72_04050 [Patescibacteria group bacterium]|nr:hypothetical protein [Patescibacteria group bacterium]
MDSSNTISTNQNFIQGQIIARLNLDFLPEADRIKLLDDMAEVINQRLLLKVLETLPKDKSDVLAKLLDEGTDDEVKIFMEKNVPDFLVILQTEIDAVSDEIAALVKGK